MILTARLHIEGHELENDGIPLLSCDYSFEQEVDERGLPKAVVKGGTINLSFISMDDAEIMWWMIAQGSDKNGRILFSGDEDKKVFKTVEFSDARCISYREAFSRDENMVCNIIISAREVTVSGVQHKNSWTNY